MYQYCNSNQTCSGNACYAIYTPPPTYVPPPTYIPPPTYTPPTYVPIYIPVYTSTSTSTNTTTDGERIKCYNGSVYHYDNNGNIQDLYANCLDNNQCTVDGCSNGQCKNELKCDGSTCSICSNDYDTYCTNKKSNLNSNFTAAVSQTSVTGFGDWWWLILILIIIILVIIILRRNFSRGQ